MATPRIVIVHRRTELQELLDRHSTRGQAEFFLRTRGRSSKKFSNATTTSPQPSPPCGERSRPNGGKPKWSGPTSAVSS